MTTKTWMGARLAVDALALLTVPFAACSDEDTDGATTDEKSRRASTERRSRFARRSRIRDQGSNEDHE